MPASQQENPYYIFPTHGPNAQPLPEEVHERLQENRILILYGAPGAGKTSFALAFRELITRHNFHPLDYKDTYFVDATGGAATVRNSLVRNAVTSRLPLATLTAFNLAQFDSTRTQPPVLDHAALIKEFLSMVPDDCLFIFDNVEQLNDLEEAFDVSQIERQWALLTMTRRFEEGVALHGRACAQISMPPMSVDNGVTVLAQYALGPDQAFEGAELESARQFCAQVDGYPLAIVQAGAHMRQENLSMGRYATEFNQEIRAQGNIFRGDEFPEGSLKLFQHRTIHTTTQLTLGTLRREAPLAESLLYVAAMLAEESLPEALFLGGASVLIEANGGNAGTQTTGGGADIHAIGSADTEAITNAIRVAQDYLLFAPDRQAPGMFRLHSTTRSVLSHTLPERRTWQERAVRLVNRALTGLGPPDLWDSRQGGERAWLLYEALYPHAEACLQHIRDMTRTAPPTPGEETDKSAPLQDEQFAQCHVPDQPNSYTLREFEADTQVRLALESGEWIRLFGQGDDLSYDQMYLLETPAGQSRLRRMIMALFRIQEQERARHGLACMFFVTHYWWAEYQKETTLCAPILEAMETVARRRPDVAPATKTLIDTLHKLYLEYPASYHYKERTSPSQEKHWEQVGRALRQVRTLLAIDGDVRFAGHRARFAAGTELTKAECFVRGITNHYLAEALRYAPGLDGFVGPYGTEIQRLYREAVRLFAAYGDTMHGPWAGYEWADALAEVGQTLDAEMRRRAQRGLRQKLWASLHRYQNPFLPSLSSATPAELRRKAMKRLTQANKKCGKILAQIRANREVDGRMDRELYANILRIRAEVYSTPVYAAEKGTRHKAWALYNLALLAARGFVVTDQDAYARALYQELQQRLLDSLEAWVTDQEYDGDGERLCRFLAEFWACQAPVDAHALEEAQTALRQLRSSQARGPSAAAPGWRARALLLLPPVPRLASEAEPESSTPGDDAEASRLKVDEEDLERIREMLARMPEHVRALLQRPSAYPYPDNCVETVELLCEIE